MMMHSVACGENLFNLSGLLDMNNGWNSNVFAEDQEDQYQNGDSSGNNAADLWQPYNVHVANSGKRDNECHLDLHSAVNKRTKSSGADFGGIQPGTAYRSNPSCMDSTLVSAGRVAS
jgi:hypothetical protein